MKIRTVTSLREFDDLAKVWREVVETGNQSSAMVTHEWFATCWRTAGPGRARELWIVEDAAGPLALVPLLRARTRYRGLPTRVVQLMHAPEYPNADLPVARDVDAVMNAVTDRLGSRRDWDIFLLPGLSAHSGLWKAFESAAGGRFTHRIGRVNVPYLPLWPRDAALGTTLDALRAAAASTIAGSGDALVVEEHRDIDPRGPLFEEIMSVVHTRSQGPSILSAPTAEEVRRFFRELTVRAVAQGWLRLWVLRFEGRMVETEYQIASHGTVRALRRDGDQGPAGFRVGDVLSLKILEALVTRSPARTYFGTARSLGTAGRSACHSEEALFVEIFADRSYQRLMHRIETGVASFARRLGGQRGSQCA
jgi:hypothetical protein